MICFTTKHSTRGKIKTTQINRQRSVSKVLLARNTKTTVPVQDLTAKSIRHKADNEEKLDTVQGVETAIDDQVMARKKKKRIKRNQGVIDPTDAQKQKVIEDSKKQAGIQFLISCLKPSLI